MTTSGAGSPGERPAPPVHGPAAWPAAIVESSDDAIIGKTLEGTITSWNGGAERIYGYSAEEAVGRSISMLVPPELSDEIPTILQKLRRGETIAEYETARITTDGRRLNISLTVSPIRDSSGEIVGASTIARDITGRKQTEVALRAGQEHLSRIVETVADGIVLVDRSGRITFANTAAEEMFGMRRASIARRTYNDPQWKLATLDNEPFPEEELPFVRVIDTGEPVYDVELALELSDGSRAILSVNGAPLRDANGDVTGMVASFSDITGRKRVEEELRRRDAISEVVRFAAECLLRETATWEQGVQEVLERFGHATEVSRVYIFENFTGDDGELWATNTHEWVAPGVSSQIDNPLLMALPYEAAGFGRWAEALRQGETIHGHTREFSEEEQRELVAEGTLSIALVPIFVGEEWWGFIGFDECVRERGWAATELDALRAAADTLGAAIRRKETQQALRQERDFSSAVLDTAGALVVVMDREGRIVRFNRACESLTGYPFEEVRGRLYWELFLLPEERERVNAMMGDVRAGRYPTAHENHWVMRDGSQRLISWNNTALLDEWGEPEYLVGTGIDITERRQAEDELRESQRTLATLMSNLPGMAYRCRNDVTWTMDFVSEGCLGLTGHPAEDLVGSRRVSYGELIHSEDRPAVWEEVQAAVREDRSFQITYRITPASGEAKWVLEQGRGVFSPAGELLAIEGFISDVTERVGARELLERRVEERTRELTTLLEVSRDVASTLELEPLLGLILEQLRAVVDYKDSSLLVYDGDDLVTVGYRGPVPWTEIMGTCFPPDRSPPWWGELGRLEPIIIDDVSSDAPLARAYRQAVGEDRLKEDFGHIRSWLGVPLVSKERAIGLLAITHDEPGHYTDRHATLATAFANQAAVAIENARLYEQAQSFAALEERQRLARELHDSVSQALYGITLGSDAAQSLLERDPSRLAEPLKYVRSLAEAGLAEMRALIFELRPESLEAEGLVSALEKQAAALEARHDIPVRTDLCAEPALSGETREALYRIAQEALHNTLKHARATVVELRLREEDPTLVTLEVSDDGVGFDPAGSFPGHLGLHSMRERAERLGGTLEVWSEPGGGTRIGARIPSRGYGAANGRLPSS